MSPLYTAGFYLGYLRGRSFPPPKKCPAPPPAPKRLLSLQYISNYIGKSSRRDEVSAHTLTFLNISEGHAPGPPKEARGLQPPGLLPRTINPR